MKDEYFYEYDDSVEAWCVFRTFVNTGHCYATFAAEESAKKYCDERNFQ